jgi:hypothetical protein
MNRGVEFERQLRASVPSWASVVNIPSPTPPPRELWALTDSAGHKARLEDLILEASGLYSHLATAMLRLRVAAFSEPDLLPADVAEWLREADLKRCAFDKAARPIFDNAERIKSALGRMRGIDKPPFDLILKAPGPPPFCLSVSIECKSAGDQARIPFEAVKPHQRESLEKETVGGGLAGVAVEFRGGEAYYLPIAEFLRAERQARAEKRSSLTPLMAQEHGIEIPLDATRGRTHRYYRVGSLLLALGATPPADAIVPEQPSLLSIGGRS